MVNNVMNATNEYKKQSIMTSTKEELTLTLYNGCLKFINDGIIDIENKRFESANTNIQRAQDIVIELICTLDMNMEISANMKLLYEYAYNKLLDGNVEKKAEHLKEALDIIREFRDAWFLAMKAVKSGDSKNAI